MNWLSLLEILWTFFGPIIKQWLEDLFRNALPKLNALAMDEQAPVSTIIHLFDAAERELRWFQWRKRAILNVARRQAIAHADQFFAAMRDLRVARPVMSSAEAVEMCNALGA
jgi:hypothetical protein